jgi:LCP family protein required for cell wall assembly
MANQYDYSYNQNKRILEIRDAQTNKVLFVPKVASGAVENWQTTRNADGSTKIEYSIGNKHFEHFVQGEMYSTLITNPSATQRWEAEKGFQETRFANTRDEQACLSELGMKKVREEKSKTPKARPYTPVPTSKPMPSPTTPPSPPAPAKPNPKVSPKLEGLTASEKALIQRDKESQKKTASSSSTDPYGPFLPPASASTSKAPLTNPSASSSKAEVGVSFPPPSSNTEHPNHYHFEKKDGNLILKDKDGNTLYSTPATKENEFMLTNPNFDSDHDTVQVSFPNKQGGHSLVTVSPKNKTLLGLGSPSVYAVESDAKDNRTTLATNWRGELDVKQTPEQHRYMQKQTDRNQQIETVKINENSLNTWKDRLSDAQKTNKSPAEIKRLEQEVEWAESIKKNSQETLNRLELELNPKPTTPPKPVMPPSKPSSPSWWDTLTGSPPTEPVLVMGMDEGGTRPDTMMLVNPTPKDKELGVVSLPRDTKAVGKNGKPIKLNGAGGAEQTLPVVNESLGTDVKKYIAIKPEVIVDVVDALGGVDVPVEKAMKYEDKTQKLKIDIPAGDPKKGYKVNLKGKDAEGYVRFRADGNGDVGRIPRQQAFVQALKEKAFSPSVLPQVPAIIQAVQKNIKTNMTTPELLQYANYAKDAKLETSTLQGSSPPLEKGKPSYFIPNGNQPALQNLQRKTPTKPATPKKVNPPKPTETNKK